ncbi:MAG TPA: sugar phosphate isomerase/epimerase family protein, partial [Phycisphaerae bacterium]|nr:sugar phosphate isomerase/epimerase family protein [Phycisphaerae bacterium]
MPRPITLFSGQWADLPLDILCKKVRTFGYDGVELACWGDHFEVRKAMDGKAGVSYLKKKWQTLEKHKLKCFAISAHLVGQAVCDRIDARHKAIVPDYVWGDGNPEGVRQRAAEELKLTARACRRFFEAAPREIRDQLKQWGGGKMPLTVNGFTGSPIWHLVYSFPPVLPGQILGGYKEFAERFNPILDVFEEEGVRFALEVHPTEIAFDIVSAQRALEAVLDRPSFGFNYDPSHFVYQGVDYIQFIREFGKRIFHVHMKDAWISPTPRRSGTFGSHLPFGDAQRNWEFRSLGRGSVNFEEIVRALNFAGYRGPLSCEGEDQNMDREHGAAEAAAFLRRLDFARSEIVF